MEELVRYDPHLVVGILGGSERARRYDAFKLLAEAKKYGARVALFGRKINNAENQLAFIQFLRLIVDGVIGPVEAVKAYHAVLGKLGIKPKRTLPDDLVLQSAAMSYGGTKTSVTVPAKPEACACKAHEAKSAGQICGCHDPEPAKVSISLIKPISKNGFPSTLDGRPDFSKMDVAQRLAYHRDRLGLGR